MLTTLSPYLQWVELVSEKIFSRDALMREAANKYPQEAAAYEQLQQ